MTVSHHQIANHSCEKNGLDIYKYINSLWKFLEIKDSVLFTSVIHLLAAVFFSPYINSSSEDVLAILSHKMWKQGELRNTSESHMPELQAY